MAITPTQQPVPSTSPRDLKYNAGLVDEFVTSLALRYIDRFGQPHYTIEGLRELAMQAIASFGFVTIRSFGDGATLTAPNQVLLWEQEGDYFKWEGTFPKSVPANSSPYSTGGIAKGAWVSVGDAALRSMLSSSAGAAQIGTSTGNTVQQELDAIHVSANVRDPRFAGGAKGNWNAHDLTGTDDTMAVQAAIDYLASVPGTRNGGSRVLFFPQGVYRIKNLVIPANISFGLDLIGVSRDATILYVYNNDDRTIPGILFKTEFSTIDNMRIIGCENETTWTVENSCQKLIEVKLEDGRPDCDITIGANAGLHNAEVLLTIHGRGLLYRGSASVALVMVEIICDQTNWSESGGSTRKTGMRDYSIVGVRTDTISIGIRVTGGGQEKDYINSILVSGSQIYSMDRLIQGVDATFNSMVISGNTAEGSFSYGVIECKRLYSSNIIGNSFNKHWDRDTSPTKDEDFMHGMVSCSGSIEMVNIIGNQMSWNTLQVVTVGSNSKSLTISNNIFINSYLSGSSALIVRGANCELLDVSNNQFNNVSQPALSVNVTGTSQTSPTLIFKDNNSTFPISGGYVSYTPVLKYGSTVADMNVGRARYFVLNRKASVEIQMSSSDISSGSSSDEVSFSLPLMPAVSSTLSSFFSGSGVIDFTNGGVPFLSGVRAVPGGGVIFIKSDGTSLKRSDLTASYALFFSLKYSF